MIDTVVVDRVATLTMASGKVNALDLELVARLDQELSRFREDSAVDAVIIAGNSRVFSAGVDLKRLIREDLAYLDRFLPAMRELFAACFRFPRPLVMAITGHAVAGGCVIACTGDCRIVACIADGNIRHDPEKRPHCRGRKGSGRGRSR